MKKIAVIGGGISGLGAAYFLDQTHDVTLYEKNDYIGGHSRTIDVTFSDHSHTPVDTGFIVFNHRNYPLLVRLFERLNVPTVKSDMSFGASIANGWLEYGSKNMFAQKRNVLRPLYWKMLSDVLTFNAKATNDTRNLETISLGDYLDELGLGEWFSEYYLQPMGAAIWSCSIETIRAFPAKSFLTFFRNHGLLTINDHPQWYTVNGGSREYVTRLLQSLRAEKRVNTMVTNVTRRDGKVVVTTSNGATDIYDEVVFACHADDALSMINDADIPEREILEKFQYQNNNVIVHGDESFMPKKRGAWASWVYLSDSQKDGNQSVSLTYWMNNLQKLNTNRNLFITLNPGRMPRADLIYNQHIFKHPKFNVSTYDAQRAIGHIQGKNHYWFCGAYQRYGFHEDGLLSSYNVVQKMGVDLSWF